MSRHRLFHGKGVQQKVPADGVRGVDLYARS